MLGLTHGPGERTLPLPASGMTSMAPVDLPYLHVYRHRNGKRMVYFRRGGVRVRLRGELGSHEFLAAYQAALAKHEGAVCGNAQFRRSSEIPRSLGALIASYRDSPEWAALAPATRQDYAKGLTALAPYANGQVALLRRRDVRRIQQELSVVPSRANKAMTMLSILMQHALELEWRTDNPALKLKRIAAGGEGYRAWRPEEVAQFVDRAGPYWRFALLLALCTGQRGQDVIRMRRDAYDGTAIQVTQAKTGARVWIPCHPTLRSAIPEPNQPSSLYLLPRPNGKPWSANAFQHAAGQVIRGVGLSGPVWHGLRATAASWLAEAGCSDAEIMAITGHTTTRMVQHYRRGAEQRKLAVGAIAKLKLRHEE